MNCFDEMRQAVREAELQLRAADLVATQLASLLKGRLAMVTDHHALASLKRELRDYDIRTGSWKKS